MCEETKKRLSFKDALSNAFKVKWLWKNTHRMISFHAACWMLPLPSRRSMRSSVALQFLWGCPGKGATQLPGIGSGDGAEHAFTPVVEPGRELHLVHDGALAQSASRVHD